MESSSGRAVALLMNVVGMGFVWVGYDHVRDMRAIKVADAVLKSSFLIYVMHSLVGVVVQYPMLKTGIAERCPLAFCVVSYALMVCVPILCWRFLHRYAPQWLRMALTGGR